MYLSRGAGARRVAARRHSPGVCVLRFRPIIITTLAALFGALPIALGHGAGMELRVLLGMAIVGGLILSQMLALFTTPAVHLRFDRLAHWVSGSGSRTKGYRRTQAGLARAGCWGSSRR